MQIKEANTGVWATECAESRLGPFCQFGGACEIQGVDYREEDRAKQFEAYLAISRNRRLAMNHDRMMNEMLRSRISFLPPNPSPTE